MQAILIVLPIFLLIAFGWLLRQRGSEDEKKKKLTYVSLHGMESSREQLHLLTEKAVDAISDYYDNAEFFRDLAFRLEKRTK